MTMRDEYGQKAMIADLKHDRGASPTPCPSCGGVLVNHTDADGRFDCLITRCVACGFTTHADDYQSSSKTWKMFATAPAFKGPHPQGSHARRCYSDLRHLFICTDPDQINCNACDAIRISKGLPNWDSCWTEDDDA